MELDVQNTNEKCMEKRGEDGEGGGEMFRKKGGKDERKKL